ncbi:PucR family transcriptional regulator ligand-binding domain-containing protein [Streptomyces sp. NPDC047070]|uniref:PucR family transcriptional regulator n=1 Tax=Streptomyces sp. NPDC047070 TaxID=3154923 RepID=UPI003452E6D9
MVITVDGLIAVPSLGLTYLAGSRGGSRPVTWAHACDLPDPWRWFQAGDLVMTTGGGLPAGSAEQTRWIDRLIGSRVSGLVLAMAADAPEVTPGLRATAEEHDFPVLLADFDLQFVTLARTVIESAVESERERLATTRRLYDMYWQSLRARGTFDERLSALEGSVGWALEVRDLEVGETLARGQAAANRQPARPGGLIDEATQVPLPGTSDVTLMVRPGRRPVQDRLLLQHLGGLIALELEHHAAQRDHLRASGQDLLVGLLDETIDLAAVWPELRHRGMAAGVTVACWKASDATPLLHEHLHHDVRLRHSAPLLAYRSGALLGIVPDDSELLTSLTTKLGGGCAVGLSTPLAASSRVSEAARQARLAVAGAHEAGTPLARYGTHRSGSWFLPHSIEETRQLVRRTLGPLLTYDRDHGGDLVTSLRTFLANDGAVQRSSDRLGIHRQTLVYRLRKVEQLTGLKPTSTRGAAVLWLALQAADSTQLPLDDLTD